MKHLIRLFAVAAALATASIAGAYAKGNLPVQLQPTITGSVASANEHSVTVNTDGRENLVFEVDSRSMVPTELPPGTRVRIEFHLMESGKYHAARITPIRGGEMTESEGKMPAEHAENYGTPSSEGASTYGMNRPQESSTATSAGTVSSGHEVRTEPYPAGSATTVQTSEGSPSPTSSETSNQTSTEPSTQPAERTAKSGDQELPQTSSSMPLIGILGLMALGAGLFLWLARRRRSA